MAFANLSAQATALVTGDAIDLHRLRTLVLELCALTEHREEFDPNEEEEWPTPSRSPASAHLSK